MIIKISGKQLAPANLAAIVEAWHAAGRPAWAIVHGGGVQLDAALAAFGPVERVDGLRVTPLAAAALVESTLTTLGNDLALNLAGHGAPVVHACGLSALPMEGLGATGRPVGYDGPAPEAARLLLVTPIGHGPEGPLNINADDAVACLAGAWPGHPVTFITDVDGVRLGGQPLASVAAQDIEGLVHAGHVQGGMIAKLRSAALAVHAGAEVRIGSMACLGQDAGTVVV